MGTCRFKECQCDRSSPGNKYEKVQDTTADCQSQTCSGLPVGVNNNFCATYDCHYRRPTRRLSALRPTQKYLLDRAEWRRQNEQQENPKGPPKNCQKAKSQRETCLEAVALEDKKRDSKPLRSKALPDSIKKDFAFLPDIQKGRRQEQLDKELREFHRLQKKEEEEFMLEHFVRAEAKPITTFDMKLKHWTVQRQRQLELKLQRQIEDYDRSHCPTHENPAEEVKPPEKQELDPLLPSGLPHLTLTLSRTPYNYSTRLRKFSDPRPRVPPRDPNNPKNYREDALGSANVQTQSKMADRRHSRRRYLDDGKLWPETFVWGP